MNQGKFCRYCLMNRYREISPELLGVYASLVFVIGSLITLAASIISYRENKRSRIIPASETADIPILIR